MLADARVQAALEQIRSEHARTLEEQVDIAGIPAPPFNEATRAEDYARRLRELGLKDVTIDAEGNVIGRRKGVRERPILVLSAHLDTVFPEGADVTVRERDGRYFGQGVTDDARGLAVNLVVLRALERTGIETVGEILFVGTVGEEGLGNLRGVKALLRDHPTVDGFISVDGVDQPHAGGGHRTSIITQATGSHRWRLTFNGSGGHSFNNFGIPSAVHAMGRAIARIADLDTPDTPKTTFTVGVVSGGTAVNAIAAQAEMLVDIRSNEAAALAELESRIMAAAEAAVEAENARWSSDDIHVRRELVGDRPAGAGNADNLVVSAAIDALQALDQPAPELRAASTDSNVAFALGIPAATLKGGGVGDQFHSPDEWYEPSLAWLGPQHVLLTALALAGIEGTREPALPVRRPADRSLSKPPAPRM